MGRWHLVPCHAPSYWETPAPEPGGRRGAERGRQIPGEPVATGCCSHAADAARGRQKRLSGRPLLTSTAGSCLGRVNQCPNVNTGEGLGSCVAAALPTPAGGTPVTGSHPSVGEAPPPLLPAPARAAAGGQSGRAGGGAAAGGRRAPCGDAPTFLPEERRRPEGAVRLRATPEPHGRDIFFPFDTSDFST